jgi:hypothetical protein
VIYFNGTKKQFLEFLEFLSQQVWPDTKLCSIRPIICR